jgi:transcriptional regulator
MYVQPIFEEQRSETLFGLIAANPLGAIVTTRGDGIEVDHLPFSVHPEIGTQGTLRCHSARGNPIWNALLDNGNVTVVFQSPNAYISPTWMPGRKRHGKVAPSWNYAAVHVYGQARIVQDHDWLKQHLHDLSAPQEVKRDDAWSLAEAPPEFVNGLLDYIVGIEITVERLVGKWFVGQQRSPSDREGVITGLLAEKTDAATAVAEMMKSRAPKKE